MATGSMSARCCKTTVTLVMGGLGSLNGFLAMLALNLADTPEAREAVVANPALLPDAIESCCATTLQRSASGDA